MFLHHRNSWALGLLLLAGCGATARTDIDDGSNSSRDAGDGDAVVGDVTNPDFEDGSNPDADAALPDAGELDEPHDYEEIDPHCRDAAVPPEPPSIECDPLGDPRDWGCSLGETCKPYVIQPEVECGQATYGTACRPAGSGKQGSPCGDMIKDCAAGFMCLISENGTLCHELCELDRIGVCEDGLVCFPIDDLPGYGGCL